MLKLKESNIDESISIKDMRVGQIGIVTEWSGFGVKDSIVKRTDIGLICLSNDDYWENTVFEYLEITKRRVKILPNGTELIICNNE